MSEQETPTQQGAVAEGLRKAKELTGMTVQGARSTVDSVAGMAAGEASATAEAAASATQGLAEALGGATTHAVHGVAHSTGALLGGAMGTAGGMLMAAQIMGGATVDAVKGLAGSTAKAAGGLAEGFAVALEDQERGAEQVKHTAMAFAQEAFDATAGMAFGALGGATTMTGAVYGGVKGAAAGTVEGVKVVADAGADVAFSVVKETSKGRTEVARRVLRRSDDEA